MSYACPNSDDYCDTHADGESCPYCEPNGITYPDADSFLAALDTDAIPLLDSDPID